MDTESENLVNLEQWKNKKSESTFSDYLKVLSFNDLVNESNELIDLMKKSEESDDFFSKTRIMLGELGHRLEKESKYLAESVKSLIK